MDATNPISETPQPAVTAPGLVRQFYTVPEAAAILGIGLTLAWALTRSGELRTVRMGLRAVRVPVSAIEELQRGSAVPAVRLVKRVG